MSRSRALPFASAVAVAALALGLSPAASAASHRRPTAVTASVAAATVTNRPVTYAVQERPRVGHRRLEVQTRVRGHAWHTVARLREDTRGRGRTSLRFSASGRYEVRTLLARQGRHVARISPTRSISVTPSARPLVVAHRGGDEAGPYSENTMAAFGKALASGATAMETDVRATAPDPVTGERELVLMHDPSLVRTTDARAKFPGRASYDVSTFTPDQLSQIRAGSKRDLAVPSLADLLLLAIAHPEMSLRLEAKTGDVVLPMVDAVQAAGLDSATTSDRIIYTSFGDGSLARFRDADPDANVQLIAKDNARNPVADAQAAGASWLSVHRTDVTPSLVTRAHQAGIRLDAYTVRNAGDTFPLADAKVDAVTTDLPGAVLRLFPGLRV